MGIVRIHGLVNAIMEEGIYNLTKYLDPFQIDSYAFDFSGCNGTLEEAVLALAAVEQVFRIYPSARGDISGGVIIENRIDDFLKAHFAQYSLGFTNPAATEDRSAALQYGGLNEDPPLDQAIPAIRRK